MKAAVLHAFGGLPRYQDFPDPVPGPDEALVRVRAVALENVDKDVARGTHFASRQFMPQLPAIPGFDGIGLLEDGRLVGFAGMKPPFGAMAEQAVVPAAACTPIPDGIDAVTAAAVPGPALTALLPLKWAVRLEPGETVLVNGATGVAGQLAVQVARLLGAGRVVGSGRNPAALRRLPELGADAVIDLTQDDARLAAAFRAAAGPGYDVMLDFLWGHPTEVLVGTLVPHEISLSRHRIRLVQAGAMAGAAMTLPADALRMSGLEIYGGATGLTPAALAEGSKQVWELIRAGKLRAEVEAVPLKDIETAWQREVHGKRLVIVP